MRLNDLHPAPGSTRRRRRVGRGSSSGMGKTSTRGHKGQKSRAGATPRLGFEGGQTPLYRRLPQRRGFRNAARKEYAIVNLGDLERFESGAEITPEILIASGLVKKIGDGIKILGDGEITKAVTVRAHKFSASARGKLTACGGTAEEV
ncbi:MAG: 50S ribosomal protein L15 [Armatimonadetes bacterium RBG_16_58_9]|nr:MAG: 50S ribosomal protein L15 [Armatimonadetes bacterium RBG_16_58_9]